MSTMKTLLVLVLCFWSFLFPTRALTCKMSQCPQLTRPALSLNPLIKFPFRRVNDGQPERCGYPGFDLSCNDKNQTILTTTSGDLSVTSIDYWSQRLEVNDPDNCMPGRYLVDFAVDLPFKVDSRTEYRNLTFLNCTVANQTDPYYFRGFPCLGGDNYTVGVMLSDAYEPPSTCRAIKTVPVPFRFGFDGSTGSSFYEGLLLTWEEPYCESCRERGGTCGFESGSGLEIGCSRLPPGPPRKGSVSKSGKFGIIIGTIVVSILVSMVICQHYSNKATIARNAQQPHPYTIARNAHQQGYDMSELRPVPAVVATGLSMSVIESYSKRVIGESELLTNSNGENTACPICLCEYKVKEEVRMIPECEHYFHVNCIDEWLFKNATCPLCRQSASGSPPSLAAPLSLPETGSH